MTTLLAAPGVPTANERFKESFASRVWLSLILATLLHVLPFQFWPDIEVENWGPMMADVIQSVQLPPVDLPAAPAAPPRPALPVISANVSPVETTPVFGWGDVPDLQAPRPETPVAVSGDGVPFTPYTVPPTLANAVQVERALVREYPATLRDASIGGVVDLLVHIDADGRVTEARIGAASGFVSLDEAALRVADAMRFRPAMNRDISVAVWIRLPVTFQVR